MNSSKIGVSLLLALGLCTVGSGASASTSNTGSKVSFITVFSQSGSGNTWATVGLDRDRDTVPTCATTTKASYVLKLNNTSGRAWYNLLTAAKVSGNVVTIVGTGLCPSETGGTYEEVSNIRLGS